MQTVTSKDGTKIAYDKVGQGPAVVLVDGAMSSRASQYSGQLAELLSPEFTVYYYDRRGRGDSGDTKPFSVEKEIQDITALIDAAGGRASLFGLSSGGALALEAAITLGDKVRQLAIYEVPYDESEAGVKAWHEYRTKLAELVAADDRGGAVALFMKFVGVPDDMLAGMRQSPFWQGMEALAPTLVYDAAALGDDRTVPAERAKAIAVPTLLMDGGASLEIMPFMRASANALATAIPNAERKTLEGQRHDVDIKVLAPVLAEFFKKGKELG